MVCMKGLNATKHTGSSHCVGPHTQARVCACLDTGTVARFAQSVREWRIPHAILWLQTASMALFSVVQMVDHDTQLS